MENRHLGASIQIAGGYVFEAACVVSSSWLYISGHPVAALFTVFIYFLAGYGRYLRVKNDL